MFAGKMPRLEKLVLVQDTSFHARPAWKPGDMHVDLFLHLSTFTSITYLHLDNVRFPSVQIFGRLLSALPGLTTLHCYHVEFDAHEYNPGAFLRRPRKLANLILSPSHDLPMVHDICRLLVATEMASTLKGIICPSIMHLRDLHKSGIPALISFAGTSLQALALVLEASTLADGEPVPEIDFSRIVNLRHARFATYGSAVDLLPWLCDQLAKYPKSLTALRTLALTFHLVYPEDMDYAGLNATICQQLDDVLSIPPFTSLKEVILEIKIHLGYKSTTISTTTKANFRHEILPKFPKLAAGGILRVDVSRFILQWRSSSTGRGLTARLS